MSLINKMLRDLDARQVQAGAGHLPKEVRSLPEGEWTRWLGRGTWILVALAAVVYALLLLSDHWLPTARTLFQSLPTRAAEVPATVRPAATSNIAAPAAASQRAAESPPAPAIPPAAPPGPLARLGDPAPGAAAAVRPAAEEAPEAAGTVRAPVTNKGDASQHHTGRRSELPASVRKPGTGEAPAVAAPKGTRQAGDVLPTMPRDAAVADKIEQEFRKGASAYQQGHRSEAAAQFKAILKEAPRHLEARQTLLSMYSEQRQWEEAQNLLKEGLSIMPTHIDWAMSLARIQAETGQTEEAWFTLNRHAAYAEERAEYQGFAGVLLQRLKRPSEAAARFRAAARLKPGEGRWWLGLGTALEADGRAAEAREAFLRARSSEGLTPEMTAFLDRKLR